MERSPEDHSSRSNLGCLIPFWVVAGLATVLVAWFFGAVPENETGKFEWPAALAVGLLGLIVIGAITVLTVVSRRRAAKRAT
jgi:hypothetical protein